jgi:uncharacterized protein YbjT (DUF2867 family)
MSILITTPTGNIGSHTLKKLLKAGAEVSVIVRNPEKLPDSVRSRVKVHQGSLGDAAFVTKAMQGARAVLWLTPADYSQSDVIAYHNAIGTVAATAIKENKVPYVVNISSAGAHLDNAGPISGLGIVERRINEVAKNVTHLRPAFFMENYLLQLESIKNDGATYELIPGDLPYPLIATQDIADVAAGLLLETNWSGQQIRGLHGPVHLTYNEAAKILSESLGSLVKHVQITADQAYQAFLGLGIDPGFAKSLVEMYQALSKPNVIAESRTPQTTTPTTLREWSDTVLRPLIAGR